MRRLGSTTTARARQMRGVLARWERSGLTAREFGQRHGIPLSTLTWWRQVFRHAGEPVNAAAPNAATGTAVVFTEVPRVAAGSAVPPIVEIILRSGHVVRVPGGVDTDTLQRVLHTLQATC